ncbi:hypothetical protein [Histophilus somni]|uniref:hypothetical protein n=1 Tax=Histophilus somni TaxID=731 RepID=UPI00059F5014|nr:hypothetical protein [Histophilus somni]THA20688.1 hypothetical protein E5361_09860 [Histophilus somni]
MKFIKFILLLFVFLFLLKFEWFLMEKRLNDIVNRIELYIYENGYIPSRLDEISSVFTPISNSESYCKMFSFDIDGVGECFYSANRKDYHIVIYGFFWGSGNYSSKEKVFKNGSNSN